MPQRTNTHARSIHSKSAHDLGVLKNTPANVAKLLGELRKDADRIARTSDLTAAAKARYLKDLRETAALQLDCLLEDVEDARSNVDAETRRALARPETEDPTERLLRELQLQRAWARAERRLAAGATVADLVLRAANERDVATFDALHGEIAGFLLARGADQREIDATQSLIADHEDAVLPPAKLAAKQVRNNSEQHGYFADMALNQAPEELTGGTQWSEVAAGPDSLIRLAS